MQNADFKVFNLPIKLQKCKEMPAGLPKSTQSGKQAAFKD